LKEGAVPSSLAPIFRSWLTARLMMAAQVIRDWCSFSGAVSYYLRIPYLVVCFNLEAIWFPSERGRFPLVLCSRVLCEISYTGRMVCSQTSTFLLLRCFISHPRLTLDSVVSFLAFVLLPALFRRRRDASFSSKSSFSFEHLRLAEKLWRRRSARRPFPRYFFFPFPSARSFSSFLKAPVEWSAESRSLCTRSRPPPPRTDPRILAMVPAHFAPPIGLCRSQQESRK